MRIEHFGGQVTVSEVSGLEHTLALRYGANANDFRLNADNAPPVLALLIRDDEACVHYFRTDDHPGFCSVRHASASARAADAVFFANTPLEQVWASAASVVSVAAAVAAAREFFASPERPKSLEWLEL